MTVSTERVTDETRLDLHRQYMAGRTLESVAEESGMTAPAFRRWCIRRGLPWRGAKPAVAFLKFDTPQRPTMRGHHTLTAEERAAMREEYWHGMDPNGRRWTAGSLAMKYGVTWHVASRACGGGA